MINERKELQWISFCSCFLITACVKVYVTMSANFCLANFVDVLLCQILFCVLSASCMYRWCETAMLWGTFSDSMITGYVEKRNHFLMNKWLYSFALVDPLSLNLHLRFYTMVDYRLEQRLVLYNKLFIYLYKWLLPFDWMMNELNLSNITYLWYTSTRCHFDAKGIYCFGNECWDKRLIICVWMNEWSYVFVFVFIYTIIFSFYIKWRRKLKMKKPHLPNVIVLFISHAVFLTVSSNNPQTLSLS